MTSGGARRGILGPVLELADRQHGVVLTGQLVEAGVTRRVIARLAQEGVLVSVRRGAWVIGRGPTAWQRAAAVGLLVGTGSALSHTTAARFHRFPVPAVPGAPVEVSVPRARSPLMDGVKVHRVTTLPAPDVMTVGGVHVTGRPRTLIDLAACTAEGALARLFDELLIGRLVTARDVQEALGRTDQRRGVRAMRRLVAERIDAPTADSHLEARVLRVLAPLRPFEVHHQLVLGGDLLILDVAWPEPRVAIECDGWGVHSRSRTNFDRDRRRENLLSVHGWTLGHVTSVMSDEEILQVGLHLLLNRSRSRSSP